MQQFVLVIHILVCIGLVVLVLLQHGKGADIGAAFGSGASTTVFGSQGSGSFLLKLTGSLAAVFFATSIVIGYMSSKQEQTMGTVDLFNEVETPRAILDETEQGIKSLEQKSTSSTTPAAQPQDTQLDATGAEKADTTSGQATSND